MYGYKFEDLSYIYSIFYRKNIEKAALRCVTACKLNCNIIPDISIQNVLKSAKLTM